MRRFGGPNGYGHQDDPTHLQSLPVGHLFAAIGVGATAPTPPSCSLRAHGPKQVFDQGETSSCCGHAVSGAIFTTLGANAATCLDAPPSPDAIYKVGRLIDAPRVPLTDAGAQPNQILRGITAFGIEPLKAFAPDGRYSDVDPATVNHVLALGELVAAAGFKLDGWYALDPADPDFILHVRAALAAKFAVNFATFADTVGPRSVENWDPSTGPLGAPDRSDPHGGPHDLYADGYHEDATGETIVEFPNSWGRLNWGVDGYGEGNEAFMRGWTHVFVMKVSRIPTTAKVA
jgi:hypothetical protein